MKYLSLARAVSHICLERPVKTESVGGRGGAESCDPAVILQ